MRQWQGRRLLRAIPLGQLRIQEKTLNQGIRRNVPTRGLGKLEAAKTKAKTILLAMPRLVVVLYMKCTITIGGDNISA